MDGTIFDRYDGDLAGIWQCRGVILDLDNAEAACSLGLLTTPREYNPGPNIDEDNWDRGR